MSSKPTKLALAFSVSAMITSNIVGGIFVGYLLDRYFKTEPVMIVTGLVLGTIGAFAGLYRIMSRLSSDEN